MLELLWHPLAAAVAYSRVHNGVHWPSDVFAGLAVGGAIAAGTRRWWAVRDEEPAELGPECVVPALPRGEGLLVFTNPGSGSEDDGIVESIRELLPEAIVYEFDADIDFDMQIDAQDPRALAESVGCMRRRRNSGHGRDRGDKARATTCGFSRREH